MNFPEPEKWYSLKCNLLENHLNIHINSNDRTKPAKALLNCINCVYFTIKWTGQTVPKSLLQCCDTLVS